MAYKPKVGTAQVADKLIAYEAWGDPSGRPMILIMGLVGQLTMWPSGLIERLVDKGHHVITFDNRDIGLSSRSSVNKPRPSLLKVMLRSTLGLRTPTPYTIEDMASDVIGLMDALKIDRADIVGMSMGGMIAQVVSGSFQDRVVSLGLLMTTTNQALLPPPATPTLRAMLRLARWPIRNGSTKQYFQDTLGFLASIRSVGLGVSEDDVKAGLSAMFARSANEPDATHRQFLAALGAGDLRRYTRAIAAPTVVIHGAADPVFRPKAGRSVARTVGNALFRLIPNMGHDLPETVLDEVAGALVANATRGSVQQ